MSATRFVTDSSLDFLARRLRVLGFDVVTLPHAPLSGLFQAARREGRVVLTSSARHPRRYADVPAVTVACGDPAGALRAVAIAHQPDLPPFARCTVCNRVLESRTGAEAAGHVPPGVLSSTRSFRRCPGCGRWYWPGSHTRRLRDWLEAALGRPLPGSGARAGPG